MSDDAKNVLVQYANYYYVPPSTLMRAIRELFPDEFPGGKLKKQESAIDQAVAEQNKTLRSSTERIMAQHSGTYLHAGNAPTRILDHLDDVPLKTTSQINTMVAFIEKHSPCRLVLVQAEFDLSSSGVFDKLYGGYGVITYKLADKTLHYHHSKVQTNELECPEGHARVDYHVGMAKPYRRKK